MGDKYRLPCSCGRHLIVETRLAGETARCDCGNDLEVPPLLVMKSLELASPAENVNRSAWGVRHALALVGVVVLAIAGVLAVILVMNRPTAPYSDQRIAQYRNWVATRTPAQTWRLWHDLKRSELAGFDAFSTDAYDNARMAYQMKLAGVGAIALAGVGLLVAAALCRPASAAAQEPEIESNGGDR